MSKVRGLGVAAVFLVGCAVGGVGAEASQFVVPQASAQQAATLTKWEYKCMNQFNSGGFADMVSNSNQLGMQGWELVAGATPGNPGAEATKPIQWCFKRPKL